MDKNKVLNRILACLYVPLSTFCFMCYMGIVGIIDETNIAVIVLTNVICYIGLFMPVIVILSIVFSEYLYKRNYIKMSYIIRFIPIYLFVIMIILEKITTMIR